MEPKEITVSELREQLPEILHDVLANKQVYVVTKHGLPFAKLHPIDRSELLENQFLDEESSYLEPIEPVSG